MNQLAGGADLSGVDGTTSSSLAALGAVTALASGSLFLALFWVAAQKQAFGLLPLLLLNCLGFYVGCRVMRLTSIRRAATLLVVVLTLAVLGFASLWMSLVWVATEGPDDRENALVFWPPTVVAVWFLGSAALVIGAQARLLLPYMAACFGALIVFAIALEAALYMPIPVGLIGLLGLNAAAVYLAWNGLLRRLEEKD